MVNKATDKGVYNRTVLSVAFHFAKKGRIVMTDTEIMLKDIGMVYRTNDGIAREAFSIGTSYRPGERRPC